ncbi:hypothetical protein CHLRE_05g241600v5 [Chlamydomonas reinhardtii]|uniref:Uncharacterized protein n=1 Tax=Chlamydomonas reinhardtii TaxID=3055 RepID=A8I514_CHLRE|nr:uncharacterized protein CHLRE_05g241600v5 [Chlamydomonas reinhardtii]PNW83487.1 hypothetical protein CHLRE_05g241600v5 [Chlamydomonas reinhardtii]|eukprot:XP_001700726.1 hypothetical protein CHLREDRAFT_205574 [Chlamydomonas reinhardtii]
MWLTKLRAKFHKDRHQEDIALRDFQPKRDFDLERTRQLGKPTRSSKHSLEVAASELPSAEERIAMMDEVRELRLKSSKTPEEWRRQREITAWLNALALPV